MGEHKAFDPKENTRRPEVVRAFLSSKEDVEIRSDGHYLVNNPSFIMRPLGLEGDALADVLGGNFLRLVGGLPKAVNGKAVLTECARLRDVMEEMKRKVLDFTPDTSVIEKAEKFFG